MLWPWINLLSLYSCFMQYNKLNLGLNMGLDQLVSFTMFFFPHKELLKRLFVLLYFS